MQMIRSASIMEEVDCNRVVLNLRITLYFCKLNENHAGGCFIKKRFSV